MFLEETVFILGAGASVDYGYPTGKDLVTACVHLAEDIAKVADNIAKIRFAIPEQAQFFAEFFGDDVYSQETFQSAWLRLSEILRDFIEKINAANPSVIDHFLSGNPQIDQIGRLLIAKAILQIEAKVKRLLDGPQRLRPQFGAPYFGKAPHVQDHDWLKFVVEEMKYGMINPEDLLKNRVNFVTFNYDISLEARTWRCLEAYDGIWDSSVAKKFISRDRYIHVYGGLEFSENIYGSRGVSEFDPDQTNYEINRKQSYEPIKNFLINLLVPLSMSRRLRLIPPKNDAESSEQMLARQVIRAAKHVFVFGFGFDPMNCEVLGLDGIGVGSVLDNPHRRSIYFTNFDNQDKINRIVGRLFCDSEQAFLGAKNNYILVQGQHFQVIKSTKGVYGALAEDFSLPRGHFGATNVG